MRKATHGYRVYEYRDGIQIDCFRKSTLNYEIAKCRIFDLCRDIRLKHLEKRYFAIWDGIEAVSKISVHRNGAYVEIPYLLPALTRKEQIGLNLDYKLSARYRLRNQSVGRKAGDITNWLVKEPGDFTEHVNIRKDGYRLSKKTVSRVFGE